MDSNPILAEFKQTLGGALLETNRFGRQGCLSIWVETKALRAALVLAKEKFGLDWLENFSVAEMHGAFVISYFLRANLLGTHLLETTPGNSPENVSHEVPQLVIRAAPMGVQDNERLNLQTARDLYHSAKAFEDEAAELFGITFETEAGQPLPQSQMLLGERANASGNFPLRKSTLIKSDKGKVSQ